MHFLSQEELEKLMEKRYVTFIDHDKNWRVLFTPNDMMKMNTRLLFWKTIRPLSYVRVVRNDDAIVYEGNAGDFVLIEE